jgi:hypothetical protein
MSQLVDVAVDPEQGESDVFGAHAVADPARVFTDIVDTHSERDAQSRCPDTRRLSKPSARILFHTR